MHRNPMIVKLSISKQWPVSFACKWYEVEHESEMVWALSTKKIS